MLTTFAAQAKTPSGGFAALRPLTVTNAEADQTSGSVGVGPHSANPGFTGRLFSLSAPLSSNPDGGHVPPVVTNTTDSDPNFLRQALVDALDGDSITFNIPTTDPGYNADVWTITVTSGELVVDKHVTIDGPGASVLIVQRDPKTSPFRIFHVTADLPLPARADGILNIPSPVVTIQGMTISNGLDFVGGGIYNDHSNLTVNSCTLSGNSASSTSDAGGAISSNGNGGSARLTVANSTLSSNSAPNGFGGGISNTATSAGSATLTVVNST